jgi:hypothetical protein
VRILPLGKSGAMISRSNSVLLSVFKRETSLCTSTFGFGLRCPVTNVILSQAGGDAMMSFNYQNRQGVVTLSAAKGLSRWADPERSEG